jgi:hypothetical protein
MACSLTRCADSHRNRRRRRLLTVSGRLRERSARQRGTRATTQTRTARSPCPCARPRPTARRSTSARGRPNSLPSSTRASSLSSTAATARPSPSGCTSPRYVGSAGRRLAHGGGATAGQAVLEVARGSRERAARHLGYRRGSDLRRRHRHVHQGTRERHALPHPPHRACRCAACTYNQRDPRQADQGLQPQSRHTGARPLPCARGRTAR